MTWNTPRVIEIAGLQVGLGRGDVGKGGLGQNVGGDIFHRAIHDFVDEADILVFAGRHARNHFALRDLGMGSTTASRPRRR